MPSLPPFHEKANPDKPFILLLGIRQLNTSDLRAMKDKVLLRYPKYQGTVDHTGILKSPRLKVPPCVGELPRCTCELVFPGMVAHCSHSNKLQNMNKLTIIFSRKKYRNETIMKKINGIKLIK